MTKKENILKEQIMSLKKNYPTIWKWIKIFLWSLMGVPFVIWLLFFIGAKWYGVPTNYTAGDVLTFYGSVLAFFGTVLLGALALWENKKASDINEKLTKESLIAVNKTSIKVKELTIPFDSISINVDEWKKYMEVLVIDGTKDVSGLYNCINFHLKFKSDTPNYVIRAKINEVAIYFSYLTIDEVGSDDYPGYYCTDGESGGYCDELNFSNINGKQSQIECVESGIAEVKFCCLIDSINNEKEYYTINYQKIKNKILQSRKISVQINAELINNFNIITKGDFEFKFDIVNSKMILKNKLFIPTGYDYYGDSLIEEGKQ